MLGGQTADAEPAQRRACDIAFLPAPSGAWASCMPSAFLPQPTGQHGRTHCQCCNNGAQRRLSAVYRSSRPVARPRRQASRLPQLQACTSSLEGHGWDQRRGWEACLRTAAPQAARSEPGVRANGWQRDAALTLHTSFREQVLLPAIRPSDRALMRSQAGPHAGAWLAAIPADPATTLAPDIMHLALDCVSLCFSHEPGVGGKERRSAALWSTDNLADHALACPRTGLLARRGFVLERAWIQVVREAIGPEGRVVPQQWLANTTAPGVAADDRRRLDFVIYGAARGEALCCDATLVSPVRRDGSPQAGAPERDGVAIATAQRRKLARYLELTRGGHHRLCVLAAEVGGRWNDESERLVQRLVAMRARRAPATLRTASSQGRWWGALAVAVQRATCSAVLGVWTMPPLPAAENDVPLAEVLQFAADMAPSRLPLRGGLTAYVLALGFP